jgi:aldose 1-epimerase
MTPDRFGIAPDGKPVERVTLSGGGLTLNLITWGAIVQDLRLAGHQAPLVLGFDQFDHYLRHSPYFGATAGRFANRIRDGHFEIDGMAYQGDRNFLGKHMLHGGAAGVGKRNWRLAEASQSHAVLELLDRDGEMGFPGNCRMRATVSLPGDGVMAFRYEAETDKPTLVNLAHHSYFNLDGSSDILGHSFRIDADRYLRLDEELIPTGEIVSVEGSGRDFRQHRVLGPDGPPSDIHDQNYCIGSARGTRRKVAEALSPKSGILLEVATTEPGLQFYAGHKVNTPVPGLIGKPYGAFAGFCFEPQYWPDSPHHPHFPSAVLRPSENYLQESTFRFTKTR